MNNKLEISLVEANGEPVSLNSMSPDALASFISVMSSLKSIAVSVAIEDREMNFSIRSGSAQCVLEAPKIQMDSIYQELDIAMQGESDDKEVTSHLRNIQDQIKRQSFSYRFFYKKGPRQIVDIHDRLITSRRIGLKRRRKKYEYKLKVLNGFLNQIGGKNPNYHFDYGSGDVITIDCTVEEAKSINKYLYLNVSSLILCKEYNSDNKKDEYYHKAIIEENLARKIKKYINSYYKENDLVKKLTITHDFIDAVFKKPEDGFKILYYLLIAFNNKNFHLSELKTLLVISKPFKDNETLREVRSQLLATYEDKRN